MQVHRFLARDANHAIAQIRQELGPEAVVAHVRPAPVTGLSRLWRRPGIEVLADLPDPTPEAEPAQPAEPAPKPIPTPEPPSTAPNLAGLDEPIVGSSSCRLLESIGLLPILAERVWEHALSCHAGNPPDGPAQEFEWAKSALASFWQVQKDPASAPSVEVFVGPHGSGKTTVLCKWLTQSVFSQGRQSCVWRLDGPGANFATHLDLHCEMLKVQVLRTWSKNMAVDWDQCFVDLPGVDYHDAAAMSSLRSRLGQFPGARVHLCLNAAYSTRLLIEQVRAFDSLPITDLILTHLDEERSWGQLWNLVVGTKFTPSFLAAGQNIPGDFRPATPEQLFRGRFSL